MVGYFGFLKADYRWMTVLDKDLEVTEIGSESSTIPLQDAVMCSHVSNDEMRWLLLLDAFAPFRRGLEVFLILFISVHIIGTE